MTRQTHILTCKNVPSFRQYKCILMFLLQWMPSDVDICLPLSEHKIQKKIIYANFRDSFLKHGSTIEQNAIRVMFILNKELLGENVLWDILWVIFRIHGLRHSQFLNIKFILKFRLWKNWQNYIMGYASHSLKHKKYLEKCKLVL